MSTAALSRSLSSRLQQETVTQHERLHVLMAGADPFGSADRYAEFVQIQYVFQADIQPLLTDKVLLRWIPDLAQRGRANAARDDLIHLGRSVPSVSPVTSGIAPLEALGWLYVSEGSTLGAAFLLKEVTQNLGHTDVLGAKNLAAYPDGRAIAWRSFVSALNASPISAEEQERVVAGANAAFNRFGSLIERRGVETQSDAELR